MTQLTQAQINLLAQAGCVEDGLVEAANETSRAAAVLIKRGFMMSAPRADGPSRLLITAEGRAALQSGRAIEMSATDAKTPAGSRDPTGKLGVLVDLLRRPAGASIEDMSAATGWQKHSVRGAISGTLKKKLGLTVTSAVTEAGRIYRLVEAQA